MEVKGNYEAVQHHWVEDEDDTCVSSISNVSDPNKERRKIERAASKACITGIPENIGDGIDAKAPSKTLQELIREIKKSSSSPPPIEIDQVPPPIIEVEHPPSQSPDPAHAPPRSGSSRHEKKSSRQGHRRSSVETPRIHTRRASMGGTTLYQTSQLAKIDSFLRGSELRLNKNGTCSFVYEDKKFTIETTAETSQFLFHCSLGRLVQWKKVWAKKLLHMMALWNEEQITKSDKEGNDQDSKDSEEDEDKAEQEVGLLRIDSSKDNPVVALILYGHADNIKSATQFQDMLDEFVDDALHFYGKLKAGPEMEEVKEVEEPKPSKSLSSKLAKEEDPKRHCKSLCSNTCSTAALTSSLTSSEPEVADAPACTQLNQPEISQDRASPAPSASSDTNNVSNGQDERTSSRKASVFGNIIKNLRSRHKEDIGKLAFIDPNQNSAFVVDTNAADAVKINISRQSRRWDSAHDTEENQPKSNLKRGSTFDVQQSRSRRSSAPTDEDQPNSHLKRGCTIDDGHRVQPKKGSSFNIEDRTRGPTKKSASSFRDDSSRLASLNKSASNLSRREPRSRSSRFNKSEPALAHNREDEMVASSSGKEYRRHQTSEHQRRKRTSSRPRRKVHCNESSQGQAMGEEYEKNRSRSRRSKSQARVPGAPPSRPPELERSSRSRSVSRKEFERSRSRSAFRKNGRSRSRSALRTEL